MAMAMASAIAIVVIDLYLFRHLARLHIFGPSRHLSPLLFPRLGPTPQNPKTPCPLQLRLFQSRLAPAPAPGSSALRQDTGKGAAPFTSQPLPRRLVTDGYASRSARKLHRSGLSVLTTNYPTVHASSTLSVRSREHTDVHPALTVQYHTFDKMHIASQNWCLCFVANCILLASSSDTAGATQSPINSYKHASRRRRPSPELFDKA
ncbi:hypothetical protein BBAD15_g10066 [Beauveria bassiana D1-5]|uniref:Uncharacterized protein n=1 Tax=Beauveria bassiana D1-5 TaxID=1245745 RepID=A0A0A2VVC4_BEABA|nr:hypothetical protein BBAD15_g10066 [Beauveria bassiana D1-5]